MVILIVVEGFVIFSSQMYDVNSHRFLELGILKFDFEPDIVLALVRCEGVFLIRKLLQLARNRREVDSRSSLVPFVRLTYGLAA